MQSRSCIPTRQLGCRRFMSMCFLFRWRRTSMCFSLITKLLKIGRGRQRKKGQWDEECWLNGRVFIGGKAKSNFVRITIEQIARTMADPDTEEGKAQRTGWMDMINAVCSYPHNLTLHYTPLLLSWLPFSSSPVLNIAMVVGKSKEGTNVKRLWIHS